MRSSDAEQMETEGERGLGNAQVTVNPRSSHRVLSLSQPASVCLQACVYMHTCAGAHVECLECSETNFIFVIYAARKPVAAGQACVVICCTVLPSL